LGKIANALGKYAQEQKTTRLPALTRADLGVLISYNRKTGHLPNYEADSERVAGGGMEAFRNRGAIQRLLDHKLIFPGGKLTPKGLAECERLTKLNQVRKPAVGAEVKIEEKIIADIDDVILELEEEVEPVEPTGVFDPPREKGAPRLERSAAIKLPADTKFEAKDMSSIRAPVEATAIERDKPAAITEENKNTAAVSDTPDKPDDQNDGGDRPPIFVPGTSVDNTMLHKNLVSLVDPQSYEAEQFKILRNNILFPVAGKTPQSILITSSMQGEGKSFVSANLAVSIAMNVNKHVLLIDCDLRKPDLHQIFGLGDGPGLSDYLVERRRLASLLQRTSVEKLSLLPGGPIPDNPSELMSSERMAEMLEEVKFRYSDRLIVIDSPPPGLAAETSFLARQVDGIVLVVEYGKTPRENVEDLMDTVGSEKILGIVINYLDFHVTKRYGYGKYGRYGRYGRHGRYGNGKK
jgi:exopolysaccharide/PEP-CTERM locus tyrosine autokinase